MLFRFCLGLFGFISNLFSLLLWFLLFLFYCFFFFCPVTFLLVLLLLLLLLLLFCFNQGHNLWTKHGGTKFSVTSCLSDE